MAELGDGPAAHDVTRREAWKLVGAAAGVVRSSARSDIDAFLCRPETSIGSTAITRLGAR